MHQAILKILVLTPLPANLGAVDITTVKLDPDRTLICAADILPIGFEQSGSRMIRANRSRFLALLQLFIRYQKLQSIFGHIDFDSIAIADMSKGSSLPSFRTHMADAGTSGGS
jgi:hypothetical protein